MDEGVQFELLKSDYWTPSLEELSGGQKTVVAICFFTGCSFIFDHSAILLV